MYKRWFKWLLEGVMYKRWLNDFYLYWLLGGRRDSNSVDEGRDKWKS